MRGKKLLRRQKRTLRSNGKIEYARIKISVRRKQLRRKKGFFKGNALMQKNEKMLKSSERFYCRKSVKFQMANVSC